MDDSTQNHVPIRSVSVVVPVFNSEATLKELVERLETTLSGYNEAFEIILVNDGSRDSSWKVIAELAGQNKNVHGISLMHNYGQHNALLAGIERARYESIITIDDDLQNPPEEIPKLLQKLDEGFDIVYGRPINRSHKRWRNIGSKILKGSMRIALGAKIAEQSSAFTHCERRGFTYVTFWSGPFLLRCYRTTSANKICTGICVSRCRNCSVCRTAAICHRYHR